MNLLDWAHYFRRRPSMAKVAWREWQKRHSHRELLGVAVFGCGGGGLMHISHYLWHPETAVRAVFDISSKHFDNLDVRLPFMAPDVQRTTDFEAILARDDIDIVSVCTPDHTHADYVVAALQAGKHVLCEKPMATTLEDCQRIIRAADAADSTFCVFQQMRFVPRNVAIKRLIDTGQLGDIIYAETSYVHDMRHRMIEFSRWRVDPEHFQHPILGSCHHIDTLRWLVGEVEEVYTVGSHKGLPDYPVDDTYATTLKMANGAVGYVLTCLGPRVPREFHPIRIYGTRGSVHNTTVFLDGSDGIVEKPLGAREYRGVPDFRAQISHFVDCVRGRAQPMAAARDAARTVAACWVAIESWKTGQPELMPCVEGPE